MIRIVTGKLGAGKTLYCTMLVFDMLCEGKIVFTNIDIVWPEMKRLAWVKRRVILDDRQLIRHDCGALPDWHEHVPFGTEAGNVEVFLDEIHLWYNAREWQKTGTQHKVLLSFLTQSRKARVNITFISQEITNVEKQFRSMAEWEEKIIPSTHMPLGIVKQLPIKFFFVLYRDAENGVTVKRSMRMYDRKFFKAYRSYQFLDTDMQELAADAVFVEPYKLARPAIWRWMLDPAIVPIRAAWKWGKSYPGGSPPPRKIAETQKTESCVS